jgi:hypothetical protein
VWYLDVESRLIYCARRRSWNAHQAELTRPGSPCNRITSLCEFHPCPYLLIHVCVLGSVFAGLWCQVEEDSKSFRFVRRTLSFCFRFQEYVRGTSLRKARIRRPCSFRNEMRMRKYEAALPVIVVSASTMPIFHPCWRMGPAAAHSRVVTA